MTSSHSARFLHAVAAIADAIDPEGLERMAVRLAELRERGGRLFLLGVGGGAANCSHAVCDFRVLAGIQAYSPCDNVAELTARTNDDGWDSVFARWLETSDAGPKDAILIMSVGGGNEQLGVSANLVRAIDEARRRGASIYGLVGRDGGYTRRMGDEVIVVPTVDAAHVTAHTEAFQAVLWHCLVFHPALLLRDGKWESLDRRVT